MKHAALSLAAGAAVLFSLRLETFASEGKPKEFTAAQRKWWAFQPLALPATPAVQSTSWAKTPIDAFVLAKLEEKQIAPSPAADKVTLLRRATLDLTGLPPTAEEAQAFLADSSADAFEKVVDRLLASPRYGERYGRHWLDLARYADSEGFKADETRPHVWRYRDYVIKSLNDDKPYDRFIQEQIAGDELFPGDMDARVAVGFNRNFPDESNQANIELRRQELLNDVTDTVGSVFMGLTYGCARCHDHKFDPILHKDYYRLQAFFANTRIDDGVVLADAERQAAHRARLSRWENATENLRAARERLLKPARDSFYEERLSRFPAEIQDALTMAPDKRTPYQWQMALKAVPQVTFTDAEIASRLKAEKKASYQAIEAEMKQFAHLKPPDLPEAQTMSDYGADAPPTYVLSGGAYDAKMEQVRPGFLSILDPSDASYSPVQLPTGLSTGRRSALARWLSDARNPLTARVIVNRVWHWHFGRGIAGSPSDFGVMGERPSHRELLDYLTATFIADGWSLKKLHRRIMLSAVYQQSSAYREDAAKADPSNKLLWRWTRRRLESEAIRDSMLAASGSLDLKMGGPGVFPPLPAGMASRGGWKKNEDKSDASRRSVYIFVRRNTRYPMMEAFDMPDTHESCARRNSTISPMQALELMNNELVGDWAAEFARRVSNDRGLGPEAQIQRAWKIAFQRAATEEEVTMSSGFLAKQRAAGSSSPLADLCHALLNSNEFLYIN